MIRLTFAASLALALPAMSCAQPALERHDAEIVATYPHETGAFTQGLFIFDGKIYESTGQVGESRLRRIRLEDGAIEQEALLPMPFFGEGSTRIGDEIFYLTWRSQQGFIFDAETFEQTDSFSYPGEGWGLTTDGNLLYMSDGTPQIRVLDPASMELTRTVDVTLNGRPARRINELEWVDGEIWANVWMSTLILRINPEDGVVTGLVDVADVVPESVRGDRDAVANGIAWNADTGQIYITGKMWPELYEIRLAGN